MKQTLPTLRTILLAVSCFLLSNTSKAQLVPIDDSVMVTYFNDNGFSSCIVNNKQLDTTCSLVKTTTEMYISYVQYLYPPISNIDILQYFRHLKTLTLDHTGIKSFNHLPDSLNYLTLNNNDSLTTFSVNDNLKLLYIAQNLNLKTLPPLPQNMLTLNCFLTVFDTINSFPTGLDTLIIIRNNNLPPLPDLPPHVKWLLLENDKLSGLPPLPSTIRYLNCDNNVLTSLPNPLPDSAWTISALNNSIASLPPLPPILINLTIASNQLTVLPTLPASLRSLNCKTNKLTFLPPLLTLTSLDASSNKLTALPELPAFLFNLTCSGNKLTSLPDLPLVMGTLDIRNNPNLTCLPPLHKIGNFLYTGTAVKCLPNYGQITASNPKIDTVPLCPLLNANNCPAYWNISGRVYYDKNSNCNFDTIDRAQQSARVLLTSDGVLQQQLFTGSSGFYSFLTGTTGNFAVSVDTSEGVFAVLCPQNDIIYDTIPDIDSMVFNQDFALTCKSVGFDVGVRSIYSRFSPGDIHRADIGAGDIANFYGAKCTGVGGTVTLIINGPATYYAPLAGALPPTSNTTKSITWQVGNFDTTDFKKSFNTRLIADAQAKAGDIICLTVEVTANTNGDNDTTNNKLTQCFKVLSSYDPNEKEAYPSGNTDTAVTQWITYTLHFQNTGTDTAKNVFIRDTLDDYLDPSTFTLLASSHKNVTQVGYRIVQFTFPDIKLPDSVVNEPASHGYVQYRVKLKPNLPQGTTVKNSASIYFDHNKPIVTNTTVNTLTKNVATGNTDPQEGLEVKIYPNPANNKLYISVQGFEPEWISILDISGKKLSEQRFVPVLDISPLSPGIYFIELKGTDGALTKRVVKL